MKSRKWWLIVGGVVIVAAVVFGILRSKSHDRVQYNRFNIEKGDIATTILATGTVAPENRLEIKAPVAGRAEQVLVVEGQKVKKGQILAWISSSERSALLDAAAAKGPEETKRWQELYRPTPVIAPINGTIILRSVEAGQTFTGTDSILTMSDRLTVQAQVDETDIAQIKLKQRASITLDAYSKDKVPAMVDQIAYDAKTVNNVTTYIVYVLPDHTPDYMRSGMTANVTFDVESKQNVLLVPAEAVSMKHGNPTVTLAVEGGAPIEREIETGLSDGKKMEVLDGLQEHDVVLVAKPKVKDPKETSPLNMFGKGPPKAAGGTGSKIK